MRYPGGKWRLARFVAEILKRNSMVGSTYVEPFAGGGSLALSLLLKGYVSKIYLNDLDAAIFALWHTMLHASEDIINFIDTVNISPREWFRQKEIYSTVESSTVELGQAVLYLNRTNHSGVLNAGMIGGARQTGTWRIDARFNRTELIRRVEQIASNANKIVITNEHAVRFLRRRRFSKDALVFIDPPYCGGARHLYRNDFGDEDHIEIRKTVEALRPHWIVSYDCSPHIRELFRGVKARRIQLAHSARNCRPGTEVLYFSPQLVIPKSSAIVSHWR